MSGVNIFAGEAQARNHHVFPYYQPVVKEKVAPSEKFTPSEEVEKGNNLLDFLRRPIVAGWIGSV